MKKGFICWWKVHRVWIISALLGMMAFLAIYGVRILDVTYDDWLLTGGDLSQHYLGWCFFRQSDWAFPIGLMDRIAYPNHVSVIFTDSIPILAVFFKLFRGLLPETFQYFGMWGMFCFGMQGALGALLVRHYTKDECYSLLGSLFFVLAPIEVYRMFMHTALGGQWLILAAFLLGINRKKLSVLQKAAAWSGLGLLCSGIHLYFVPMCGLIMCAFLLADLIQFRKLWPCLLTGAGYCTAALGNIILLGGLSHDHQLDAGGLGQFSFNLNGFVNPQGWSEILPDLSCYGDGAGEGLAFPGIGILAAIVLAAGLAVWQMIGKKRKFDLKKMLENQDLYAYFIIAVISIVISVSHRLALGGSVIWEIPYPKKIVSWWGMFRSSGRFIWPVVYMLMLVGIVSLKRLMVRRYAAVPILAILVCFQLFDSFGQYQERHNRFANEAVYHSELQDDIWETLSQSKKHIVFVSDFTGNQGFLYSISKYALENDMTINNFYFAHSAVKSDVEQSIEESLSSPSEDTIYIYKEAEEEKCTDASMVYLKKDNVIIGLTQ